MAIRGPAPKDPEDRLRRNQDTYQTDRVVSDGLVRGFDLPNDRTWAKETMEWWETWRRSPQAKLMTATDWQSHLATAVLHNMLWNPRANAGAVSMTQVANAVKSREASLGATVEDRKKLRIVVDTPQTLENELQEVEDAANVVVNYEDNLNQ